MKADIQERAHAAGLVGGVIAMLARPGLRAGIVRYADRIGVEDLKDDVMAIAETMHLQVEPFDLDEDLVTDRTTALTSLIEINCTRPVPLLFVLEDHDDEESASALGRFVDLIGRLRDADQTTGFLVITRGSVSRMAGILDGASASTGRPYATAVVE